MENRVPALRRRLIGGAGLACIALLVLGLIGVYLQWFRQVVDITVTSDRTGLLLDRGAAVRLSGIRVGEVRGASVAHDHKVAIHVAIDEDKAHLIPADITARIRSTTVFGAKFVELDLPAGSAQTVAAPTGPTIRSGAVVQADSVPIEANDTFQHAMTVLQSIDPEKLNTTLTAVAGALDGRGQKLGAYLTQVNSYLDSFNQTLPTTVSDIRRARDVLTTYADVAPQLLATAAQATTTSNTLVDSAASLHALLVDMVEASHTTKSFIDSTAEPLVTSLRELTPVTDLLRVYAPELGCLIDNVHQLDGGIAAALGNVDPGIQGSAGFLPGQASYNESNLPKLVSGIGPVCYPFPSKQAPLYPHVRFDDGTADIYDGIGPTVNPGTAAQASDPTEASKATDDQGQYLGLLRYLLGDTGIGQLIKKATGGTP